jgi:hypothetical protein
MPGLRTEQGELLQWLVQGRRETLFLIFLWASMVNSAKSALPTIHQPPRSTRDARSGGGTSSPCSFSSLGGRFFPAGPSFRPGEMGALELFCFIQNRSPLTLVAGPSQRGILLLVFD